MESATCQVKENVEKVYETKDCQVVRSDGEEECYKN